MIPMTPVELYTLVEGIENLAGSLRDAANDNYADNAMMAGAFALIHNAARAVLEQIENTTVTTTGDDNKPAHA